MISDILQAIDHEIQANADFLDFQIIEKERDKDIWTLTIMPAASNSEGIDESLEGSSAWWGSPFAGTADVLSVNVELSQINLRYASSRLPDQGGLIRIYPPRYLDSLYKIWSDSSWAPRCVAKINDTNSFINKIDNSFSLNQHSFTQLRKRQREAFKLPACDLGFLWGPPGTGKSYTLAHVVAQYLMQFPTAKVLLLSTTNVAVDQALSYIDDLLLKINTNLSNEIRDSSKRIGSHFIAKYYENRRHLIPVQDEALLKELVKLQANPPEKTDVHAYNAWKSRIEEIRRKMNQNFKDIIKKSRLIALTTTRAAFSFDDLKELSPFDLIVFDEASQVGRAHALALMPLAPKTLFAGDPMQLPPIVRSENKSAERWMGKSMFEYMTNIDKNAVCRLNEQSRMAKEICDLVGEIYYEGDLIVAEDCRDNLSWMNERKLSFPKDLPVLKNGRIIFINCTTSPKWDNNIRSYYRTDSMEHVQTLVSNIVDDVGEDNILVLTPYRAQRYYIQRELKSTGLKRIQVSTIHRAQGTEYHTVIIDITNGDTPFLKNYQANNMINVAISRAKARLIFLVSARDLNNPILKNLYNHIDGTNDDSQGAIKITEFINSDNFPYNMKYRIVIIPHLQFIGKVTSILENGKKFKIIELKKQKPQEKTFLTSFILEKYSN